jgi:hypothetical protein
MFDWTYIFTTLLGIIGTILQGVIQDLITEFVKKVIAKSSESEDGIYSGNIYENRRKILKNLFVSTGRVIIHLIAVYILIFVALSSLLSSSDGIRGNGLYIDQARLIGAHLPHLPLANIMKFWEPTGLIMFLILGGCALVSGWILSIPVLLIARFFGYFDGDFRQRIIIFPFLLNYFLFFVSFVWLFTKAEFLEIAIFSAFCPGVVIILSLIIQAIKRKR